MKLVDTELTNCKFYNLDVGEAFKVGGKSYIKSEEVLLAKGFNANAFCFNTNKIVSINISADVTRCDKAEIHMFGKK